MVGYYSGFFSSLSNEQLGNSDLKKNKVYFQCILWIYQKIMNIHAILKIIFKISPFLHFFFFSQRAVKSWIIANIHEIVMSQEFFLYFE
jgi:hypothetical protein